VTTKTTPLKMNIIPRLPIIEGMLK
jgi:hypothetical protein